MAFAEVLVCAAKRTPIGNFMGQMKGCSTPTLGSEAIKAVLQSSGLNAAEVDEVLMGCVLPAGVGQAPARQAALGAGLAQSVGATTVNKVCGSGMKAVMLGADMIRGGSASSIVAGGMESMSNAPYLLPDARAGMRIGHGSAVDHLFTDGLEDAYSGALMGDFAEQTARDENVSREEMDRFAIDSLRRALNASQEGLFDAELTSLQVKQRREQVEISVDEQPLRADETKIPKLKPAFSEDGRITAANASSISDGAAALLLVSRPFAEQHQLKPLARIVGHASHAMSPEHFTLAPIGAIQKLLSRIGWQQQQVDLFEINEAFALVTLLAMRQLGLGHERVNVHGGACALGHPIGATGARLLVTLTHALRQRGKQRGIASCCIGGGEATAVAIELV